MPSIKESKCQLLHILTLKPYPRSHYVISSVLYDLLINTDCPTIRLVLGSLLSCYDLPLQQLYFRCQFHKHWLFYGSQELAILHWSDRELDQLLDKWLGFRSNTVCFGQRQRVDVQARWVRLCFPNCYSWHITFVVTCHSCPLQSILLILYCSFSKEPKTLALQGFQWELVQCGEKNQSYATHPVLSCISAKLR